jgi:hypothetical protein
LLLTVVQATIGTFIVFLTMVDCAGPRHPTFLFDKITERCFSRNSQPKEKDDSALKSTAHHEQSNDSVGETNCISDDVSVK